MAKKNHYQVLGVGVSAGAEDIRAAWRTAARRWHPDTCKEPGAQDNFLAAKEAYAVLSDAGRRSTYNIKLLVGYATAHDRGLSTVPLVNLRAAYANIVSQTYLTRTDRAAAAALLREIQHRAVMPFEPTTPAPREIAWFIAVVAAVITSMAALLLYYVLKLILTK